MFLLDTNVVSELRKVRAGRADARVAAWADSVDAADLYLSVISLRELEISVRLDRIASLGRRERFSGRGSTSTSCPRSTAGS